MPYDPTIDVLLWESQPSQTGLVVQIKSYNNAEPKIRCMKNYTKRDGTVNSNPAYGLTMDDFGYIGQCWEQIKQVMANPQQPQQQYQQSPQQNNFQNNPNQQPNNFQNNPNQGFGG